MTEFFRFLVETNLVTAAFVIGAIAFIIAIIGRFKTIIEPSPAMRALLGVFGLFLMALSLGSYFISSQPTRAVQTPTQEPASVAGVQPSATVQPTDIPPTPVSPTQTSPIVLPTETPVPPTKTSIPPTATPQTTLVATIHVLGYQENGEKFDVPFTGRYSIRVEGGAYSGWPTDANGGNQWRTIIYIYKNRPIEWGQQRFVGITEPQNPDFQIGLWELPDKSQAETAAVGMTTLANLQVGDTLTFVPIDEKTAYTYPGNNRGEVVLEIWLVSQ